MPTANFIYIEGYLIAADDGFEAAQVAQKVAQKRDTKVALTLSDPSIVAAFKDRMTALVDAGVDMLFCNEDEGRIFTGAETTEEAFDALRHRVGGLALTCGADGAWVCDGGDVLQSPGFEVRCCGYQWRGRFVCRGVFVCCDPGVRYGSGCETRNLCFFACCRKIRSAF